MHHDVVSALDHPSLEIVAMTGQNADVIVVASTDTAAWAQDESRASVSAGVVVVAEVRRSRKGDIRRALRQGASGFVTLDTIPRALVPTILAVAAGQAAVPVVHAQESLPPTLTTREKQVLSLIVMGMGNAEIAARLYLAESTVKSHLSLAFAKLGVHSRNEAVARILDPQSGFGAGILTIPRDGGKRPS